ncbi:FAD-dependent oxidoreductase [Legionella sp. D16C41]|uniref:FAD-dependent oxidoreductase n=1 Tax=Legionella sp. D16C41 TaxID=3402688 RepID=UPI003AF5B2C1
MSNKIVIIGAGISGLVMGILLRQQGFQVEIYEKQADIAPIGGGLGIWPNGVEVLMTLPCKEKISLLPATITYDIFADAAGHKLMDVPRELFLQVNGYPIMNVCRSELHQLLAHEFGIDNIVFGAKCIKIQQKDAKVTAYFDNHREVKADLLIGADGTYSAIRKIIFPETKLTYSGYLHFLGVLRYPPSQQIAHNFIIGKNRYCLQFPISKNRHIFYQVLPYKQGEIQHLINRQERLCLFRGWSAEVDQLLDAYEQSLTEADFNQHFYCEEAYTMSKLQNWHKERVVLVGDAAHPLGSILGLGAGCGLEDSYWLAANLKNKSFSEAITAYEQRQIPRIAKFYQLEKAMTDFILNANDEEYTHFISEFKRKTPFEANQELINVLKIS